MKPLREAIQEYLALRRTLGFKLRDAEGSLFKFAAFLEERGGARITTAMALEWAMSVPSTCTASIANRLRHLRGFARHHLASDPTTQIPPVDVVPSRLRRRQPYLYSDEQLRRLMGCALTLAPADGLRPWTYYCFLGLLAAAGLRLSEAIRLEVGDVDLDRGVLTIRQTKFGKSRLIPIDNTTTSELARYRARRDRFLRGSPQSRFFVSGRGTPLEPSSIHRTFYQLLDQAEVHAPVGGPRPRLYDLRHRFALETLLRWYRAGEDVERRLPALSTYLGHVCIDNTYWYLSACPELMGHALARLEQRWEERP
jgi:integrase/recombinase XerD